MAKKKVGIYGILESTPNNKVEDLYLIIDEQSICFAVKNHIQEAYISFEHFANTPENNGWNELFGYFQNNSKLIQATYRHIHFVLNHRRCLLSKKQIDETNHLYQNEFNLVHSIQQEEELSIDVIHDQYVLQYAIPDALNTLLIRAFPTGKWQHYLSAMLLQEKEGVYIQLFENKFILCILKNGLPNFVRYYTLEETEDQKYHLLNACIQTGTMPNENHLILMGYLAERDHWVDELLPYFKSHAFISNAKENIGPQLAEAYPHNNYTPYFIF